MVALAKSPPQTMAKMLLKAQKCMNSEDALATIRDEEKPREREGKGEDRRGRKRIRETVRVLMETSKETIKLLKR